jgi:hypothetical protein
VYLGTDEQAVIDGTAPMVTVPAASTTPDLELGRTYYWRVDEVNSVEDPAVWVGLVQSFTTADSILVDDMESYKNQAGLYIFEAWVDGYQINDNGSLVGVGADFEAEKAVVHGGSQSLPMTYGDQGIADSWATLVIETPKDWNKHGIKSLSLYFHGNTTNTAGQLYVKVNNTKFEYKGVATDIQTNAWFPFTVNLAGVTTVNSLTIGVAGGAGMLIVDDIRLYPQVSELVTPVAPGTAELMASYAFEGNYQDGSGNGRHGTAVGAAVITSDAQRGSVLSLDGVDSCVDLGPSGDPNQGFNPAGSFTVAAWVNITAYTSNWGHAIVSNRGESNVGWKLRRHSSTSNLTFTVRGTAGADDPRGTVDMGAMMGSWIQVTAVFDAEAGSRSVHVNGLLDTNIVDGGACTASTHNVFIGAGASATNVPEGFFNGMIDDVKIYNRALSQAEALGLAGRTYPIYKSF